MTQETFQRGSDYFEDDAAYKSYTIDQLDPAWGAKIIVYGDPKLRDRILQFLQEEGQEEVTKREGGLALRLEQTKRILRSVEDVLDEAHEWMQAIPEATITTRINNSLSTIRRFLND